MREFTAAASFTIADDETIVGSVYAQAERHPSRVLFSRPTGDRWRDVTAAEFAHLVSSVAKGLIANGIQPGDRVVLLSATRFEWTLLDFAIWAAGAVTVPVYDSSAAEQVRWILQDSGAALAVVETARHKDLVTAAPDTLRRMLVIDDGAEATLIAEGADVPDAALRERLDGLRADGLASLVYTSGTTGRPKGCMLTHRNFLSEVRGILKASIGDVARPGQRMLTFLPLAHVLARAVSLAALEGGMTQAHWSDFKTITGQFARFRPHTILGVPRVFEKVRDGADKKAHEGGAIKGAIFRFAERTAIRWSENLDRTGGFARRPSPLLRVQHALCDRLVYAPLRAALGGDCEFAISGGGALAPRLGHFFRGVGVPIYEGYGLTESTAAHCVNVPGAVKIGTVGQPLGGNGVRIAEDGEIELSGGVVFAGYWRNEEATAAALSDGWLRTGDLGELDVDGFLSITGRKKDLLVTAGGKNVSPGPLEDRIRSHALISQAIVVGDGRTFITALITIDPEAFESWKATTATPPHATIADLRDDPTLLAEVQRAVDDANNTVSHAEAIKKFTVLPRDLSEESGELTATLKVKRHVIAERFAAEIESMYRR
ncbi:long-chain fatty acid--CoA ligase [Nocardia otitidiscaviarum]|uniref:AMP-dependent synthetase/ligase n=1 Tax=Nocardia otitidiscaviarum TaxID=1823 RepID=UPI0004A6FF6D|nr:long-chain fatty acid--CoA ligase [Nocardia otitidiscaviarum]MBF6133941.1 long-chain fatty acid--CoA ligase [Nocardia otitidiscaviarum]MBF6484398.1 long-chain fatty acid--CoA ligase [Nocardia otitidiscaviarum]